MTAITSNPDCALPTDCPMLDDRREIQRLATRSSYVGGIPVARALPQKVRRLVGAWCFLDHIGPTRLDPGAPPLKVGPHPHTSLQTFTWMIEGEILHRDSLGITQAIRPGQVKLMTAGHGISHTEESIGDTERLHAAQLWIALPREHRDTTPRFDHYPELPVFGIGALTATLLVGGGAARQRDQSVVELRGP
jgi:redox-sensitive bicupin YhaK (pirin superfamily)